jgi:hypothetical protein
MITLEFDIIDFNCKIIRAGKDLFSYVNFNLYDLFPPFLKQHQKNLFTNLIFTGFNKKLEKGKPEEGLFMKNRKKTHRYQKSMRFFLFFIIEAQQELRLYY